MYIKTNGNLAVVTYPYFLGNLKKDYPNISIPLAPTDDQLSRLGIYKVLDTTAPVVDESTQFLLEGIPEYINDKWHQVWEIKNRSEDAIARRLENEKQSIRSIRNEKLKECDWTQLPDSTVNKEIWAAYRQALRDITDQEGFPWSVIWPDLPV